ncbi:hypothetical protein FHL15_007263 [Xylaria flabelliformis]|uniref:Superoxide dismutase 1 copper chaperone n=1 Tax=Xylaria flabelliformis TaxID=2512241 RepID=A0A553HVH4_9PEZI|nr:hypothetical protein FHL15_007263 [Xylaria flabelliformis]
MTQNKVQIPFETLFAVPMTCDSCVKSVSDALYRLDGITNVDANLKDQLVAVKGTAAPSAIVSAIEATGRDAILRGSGASNSELDLRLPLSAAFILRQPMTQRQHDVGMRHRHPLYLVSLFALISSFDAAVCILETYHQNERGGDTLVPASDPEALTKDSAVSDREVRGLARMVQVSPTTTLVDLTVRGVAPGKYNVSIREYGDLKFGATSTGPVWIGGNNTTQPRGILGSVEVGKDGRGAAFLDHPVQVWEVIGHAMVLSGQEAGQGELKNDENTITGVIARSADRVWMKRIAKASAKSTAAPVYPASSCDISLNGTTRSTTPSAWGHEFSSIIHENRRTRACLGNPPPNPSAAKRSKRYLGTTEANMIASKASPGCAWFEAKPFFTDETSSNGPHISDRNRHDQTFEEVIPMVRVLPKSI